MILQALKEYGDRMKPPEKEKIVSDAFSDGVKIQWWLEIDDKGNFLDLSSRGIKETGPKGKEIVTIPPLNRVPKNVISDRSHGGNPQFLADNLEYWFGISEKSFGAKSLNSQISLAKEFAGAFPGDPHAHAVKKFFEKLEQKEIGVRWEKKPDRGKGKLVVSARGGEQRFLIKSPKERLALCLQRDNLKPVFDACENFRVFWSGHYRAANRERQRPRANGGDPPCLCCGQARPAVKPFGTFSGLAPHATSLVFTGKPAYRSYGFADEENAAICLECSQAIIRGLESLLRSNSTHKKFYLGKPRSGEKEKIPPLVFTFWTRQVVEFDFGEAAEGDSETVKRILESVHKGISQDVAQEHFYILGASESYRRTMVRYWSETNVNDVLVSLAAWFEDLKDRFLENGQSYFSLTRLCKATVRQPDKIGEEWKFPPVVSTGLFLSAFLGKPIPPSVLQMLLNRIRSIPRTLHDKQADETAKNAGKNPPDYKLKPERMALLRLTVNRLMKSNDRPIDVGLDVDRREPAYHCGRLLAVCDAAMRWSNGNGRDKPGKSTVVDRYMGSASSAPCGVLPTVYRNSRYHLNKLKRDMPAKSLQLEKLLDEILSKLTSYPATLTPQEAGIFILGFHHQRQYFFLVSRYRKLKKQKEEGTLADEDKEQLKALEDFVNRTRFDISLLADLPDEDALEISIPEST